MLTNVKVWHDNVQQYFVRSIYVFCAQYSVLTFIFAMKGVCIDHNCYFYFHRIKTTDQEKSIPKVTAQKGDKNMQPSGLCGVPFWKLQLEAEQELDKVY